jgi:ABC-2 type transport system permease protein
MDVLHGSLTGGQTLAELAPRLATGAALTVAYLALGLTYLPRAETRAVERTY